MKLKTVTPNKIIIIAVIMALVSVCNAEAGDNVQRKTFGGIGIGALAGALITGNINGLAAGAAAGGIAGYAIGTDQDRHAETIALDKEKMDIEKEKIAMEKSAIASRTDFVGTSWSITNIQGEQTFPEHTSIIVTFVTDSRVSTVFIDKDGKPSTVQETYQIVNDVLVISGQENGENYTVSGKISRSNGQLIFVTPEYHIVAEKA